MSHLHISSIPDNVTVSHAGLVRMNFTDNSIAGSICDEQGRTTQTFREQPALLSVALYSNDAVRLVSDILKNLCPADRDAALRGIGR